MPLNMSSIPLMCTDLLKSMIVKRPRFTVNDDVDRLQVQMRDAVLVHEMDGFK